VRRRFGLTFDLSLGPHLHATDRGIQGAYDDIRPVLQARNHIGEILVGPNDIQRLNMQTALIDQPDVIALAYRISRHGDRMAKGLALYEDFSKHARQQGRPVIKHLEWLRDLDDDRHHSGHLIDLPCRADHTTLPGVDGPGEVGPDFGQCSILWIRIAVGKDRMGKDIKPGQLIIFERHFDLHGIRSIRRPQRLPGHDVLAEIDPLTCDQGIERQR